MPRAPALYIPVETPETARLERRIAHVFRGLKVPAWERQKVQALLAPLRSKHAVSHQHYLHSLRVALLLQRIARIMRLEQKPLFYAGLLHDIGKAQVPVEVLGKVSGWSAQDARIMRRHVMDGYRLLRDDFNFTACIMLWHHRFQPHAYPKGLPKPACPFSRETDTTIAYYGKLLALADGYDALHRTNTATGGVTLLGPEIHTRLIAFHPGDEGLIGRLYKARIFTE